MRLVTAAAVLLLSTCFGPGAVAANLQPLDVTVLSQSWRVRAPGFDETATSTPTASVDWTASSPHTGSGNATVTSDSSIITFSYVGSLGSSFGPAAIGLHTIQVAVPDFGLPMTTLLLKLEIVSSSITADMSYQQSVSFENYTGSTTGAVYFGLTSAFVNDTSIPGNHRTERGSLFLDVVPGETTTFEFRSDQQFRTNLNTSSYNVVITFSVFAVAPGDADGDSTADVLDNCIDVANADQIDTDGDGVGDACDCDFDNNGSCNIEDFNLFLPRFAAASDDGIGADMNGDCVVGIDDFNLFLPGFIAGEAGPKGAAARGKPPACT